MMNYPMLYSAGRKERLGYLTDVVADSCRVTEQLNGAFEMTFQYPLCGKLFEKLKLYAVIQCRPNPYASEQPFVIYKISKPLNGIVTFYAEHMTYAADRCVCEPYQFYADNLSQVGSAMIYLTEGTYGNPDYSFGFRADGEFPEKNWGFGKAVTVKDARNSITSIFGGEWEMDGSSFILHKKRGENRGVAVAYGVNMVDFSTESNSTDRYTHIMPYWHGLVKDETLQTEEWVTQYADPKYIPIDGEVTGYFRPYILDCSSYYDKKPTDLELSGKAIEFRMSNPTMGYVAENYRIRFVQRGKTVEYPHLFDTDHVELGDTVRIINPRYGISDSRRVVKTVYDVCGDRLTEVELGAVKQSISGFVSQSVEKPNTTVYDGGYSQTVDVSKPVSSSAVNSANRNSAKTKIVRNVEVAKTDGVISGIKISYDDGGTSNYRVNYENGKISAFGRAKISYVDKEVTS